MRRNITMMPGGRDSIKPGQCSLVRIRLNRQGYDENGTYWGSGSPLYRAECAEDTGFLYYLRADDRNDAKTVLKNMFPSIRFFR
jgi:hypothetical protein